MDGKMLHESIQDQIFPNNSSIQASTIQIGKDFQIGTNVHIKVRGKFSIGDFGRFGNNVTINAEEVKIGNHFYHYTGGLNIGGGGSQFPEAILRVGDRCVFHNNYINLAREVTIGNDVGLSPDVQILTHGFWNSILDGYPVSYKAVRISNGVIVGQRSMILPGVEVAENIVIGANSTVSRSLLEKSSVYVGNPVQFIRTVKELTFQEKVNSILELLARYRQLTNSFKKLFFTPPLIYIDDAIIDVEAKTITGTETETTDKFRDFLRRYGIRIYTSRPFLSLC
jgi:acetyltransferase-like isoleucine patch superfamily enzyme